MAEYEYEIVHKHGSQNINADALSRIGSVGRVKERMDILTRIQENRFCKIFMIPP